MHLPRTPPYANLYPKWRTYRRSPIRWYVGMVRRSSLRIGDFRRLLLITRREPTELPRRIATLRARRSTARIATQCEIYRNLPRYPNNRIAMGIRPGVFFSRNVELPGRAQRRYLQAAQFVTHGQVSGVIKMATGDPPTDQRIAFRLERFPRNVDTARYTIAHFRGDNLRPDDIQSHH